MNLPNKISLARICMVPLIVFLYLFPLANIGIVLGEWSVMGTTIPIRDLIVLLFFAIASASDFVDGYLARKNNLVTSFGKFIDPIADKLLVNTMFILFAVVGEVPVVAVIIMIWRDTLVDGMRMQASSKGKVVAARFAGKLKTVLQMITIILVLLHGVPFTFLPFSITTVMIWLSTAVSVISGIYYFMDTKDVLLESM